MLRVRPEEVPEWLCLILSCCPPWSHLSAPTPSTTAPTTWNLMPPVPSQLEAFAQATPPIWHTFPPCSLLLHLTPTHPIRLRLGAHSSRKPSLTTSLSQMRQPFSVLTQHLPHTLHCSDLFTCELHEARLPPCCKLSTWPSV